MNKIVHECIMKKVALIFCITWFYVGDVQALQESPCKSVGGQRVNTFYDIIKKSKFIGIYVLLSTKKTKRTMNYGRDRGYEYNIELVREIKGKLPIEITVLGYTPHEHVPPWYFDLYHMHKEIVETNNFRIGSSAVAYIDDEARCRYAPLGMLGYYFLVIEGIDSGISFAPLTSPRYDPLVQKLASYTEQGRMWDKSR